ncbi:uncharacterized protein N7477_008389 [Penicillium maclennaniae]|uniref:uncharacterized protein n=1 Tax=Penicillium maclennaniae TaxID=1343394 RepID=UPI0025412D6A|nr:uncharacterized protein N7477_008389 [Penicillium maclennaniae]KAJ5665941.1 hypothetical protein N7477_008389 [Penicillium maclennaniae]
MSIPNEALQKLLQEIETRAMASQQQIGITKAQMTAKQREIRKLQLTSKELSGPALCDPVNKRLARESSEAATEITNLEKKLHYHETTHKNSRENLEQILKSGGRA